MSLTPPLYLNHVADLACCYSPRNIGTVVCITFPTLYWVYVILYILRFDFQDHRWILSLAWCRSSEGKLGSVSGLLREPGQPVTWYHHHRMALGRRDKHIPCIDMFLCFNFALAVHSPPKRPLCNISLSIALFVFPWWPLSQELSFHSQLSVRIGTKSPLTEWKSEWNEERLILPTGLHMLWTQWAIKSLIWFAGIFGCGTFKVWCLRTDSGLGSVNFFLRSLVSHFLLYFLFSLSPCFVFLILFLFLFLCFPTAFSLSFSFTW